MRRLKPAATIFFGGSMIPPQTGQSAKNKVVARPQAQRPVAPKSPPKRLSLLAVVVLSTAIFGCAIYANLSFAVTNPENFKYFPPFSGQDSNDNRHKGAEYFNIAKAMVAGNGFANPFYDNTGPTAWMPPVLPTVLAALLWITDGDNDVVMAVYIFMQVYVLVATGILVLILISRSTSVLGTWVAAIIFFIWTINDFHIWFQFTHDCFMVLLALDLLVAGLCLFTPYRNKKNAAAWGFCGGFIAMINPAVALAWGVLSFALAWNQKSWSRWAVAVAVAGLTVSPWVARNYYCFGRLIPVKSNAAYEFWQSQYLTRDGLLEGGVFSGHPYASNGPERHAYKEMGEMAFLDRKSELFWKAVRENPEDFADRVATRFLAATLWYTPFDRTEGNWRPKTFLWARVVHPLPFLALIVLVFTGIWKPLHLFQWTVTGVYLIYLLPYIGISYYDRYAAPLYAVKVLLIIWAADRLLALIRRKEMV
jgi:hypothetical protein